MFNKKPYFKVLFTWLVIIPCLSLVTYGAIGGLSLIDGKSDDLSQSRNAELAEWISTMKTTAKQYCLSKVSEKHYFNLSSDMFVEDFLVEKINGAVIVSAFNRDTLSNGGLFTVVECEDLL